MHWNSGGPAKIGKSLYSPDKMFSITATLSAYISPAWDQTRELCCLAVSESAMKELFEQANLKDSRQCSHSEQPYVEGDTFVSAFRMYMSIPVRDNLLAAISRASVSIKLYAEKPKGHLKEPPERGNVVGAIGRKRLRPRQTPIRYGYHAHAREFISSIYNLYKIGWELAFFISPSNIQQA